MIFTEKKSARIHVEIKLAEVAYLKCGSFYCVLVSIHLSQLAEKNLHSMNLLSQPLSYQACFFQTYFANAGGVKILDI